MTVELTVNGDPLHVDEQRDANLATVLRDAGYKGVKCGCDGGVCGASKVLIDGDARMACGLTPPDVDGSEIQTIESLGSQDDLHPIQQSFVDHFAVQCGFCIPGMIIEATDLLADNPDPSEREVRAALADNICRCTGYEKPIAAIQDAAGRLRGEDPLRADYTVATRGGEASD